MAGRMFKFNPKNQYGDYVFYNTGEYQTAKKVLREQIAQLIPVEYRKEIVWIRQLIYEIEENGKRYTLSKSEAIKRGLNSLAWKTKARRG